MRLRGIKLPRYTVPISIVGTAVGISVLLRDTMSGAMYKGEEQVAGRTVVITGANSGMGKEMAKEMASRGARVIMACRNMSKCQKVCDEIIEETFNRNVICQKLDLASLESIKEFAEEFNANEKRLDILINNAGVMGFSNRTLTQNGFEAHFGVNHLGPFLLTNLLLDKMKASAPSRVVTISSLSHIKVHMDFRDLNSVDDYEARFAYLRSKLANILFTKELAARLKDTGVTTYAVHPGVVKTNLGRNPGVKSDISRGVTSPLWNFLFKTTTQGIQTTLYCALSPDVAEQSGNFYSECTAVKSSKAANNEVTAKRLWAISEKWTQLT